MMMLLISLVLVSVVGTMALAFWISIVDADPVAFGTGLFLLLLLFVVGAVLKSERDRLECETLVETMVTVGDVEICMPTSVAVDLVEEYQSE